MNLSLPAITPDTGEVAPVEGWPACVKVPLNLARFDAPVPPISVKAPVSLRSLFVVDEVKLRQAVPNGRLANLTSWSPVHCPLPEEWVVPSTLEA